MLFWGGTYLDADDEAWQVETWAWFLKEFGGVDALRRRAALVTPTAKFFPATGQDGEARVAHIFDCVKRLAGMADWHCRLIAQPRSAELSLAPLAALKPIKRAPAGTFAFDGNEATISYDPANEGDPFTLITVFIHELAHYLLASHVDNAPGGKEVHEYTTDLMTVYLGFGVFGANSAFNFSQFTGVRSQGWRTSRLGYLGERAWVFALAVFLELRGQDLDEVKPFLKNHLFVELRKARRHIVKRGLLASMLS